MFVPRDQHRKANAFEMSKNVDFFIRLHADLKRVLQSCYDKYVDNDASLKSLNETESDRAKELKKMLDGLLTVRRDFTECILRLEDVNVDKPERLFQRIRNCEYQAAELNAMFHQCQLNKTENDGYGFVHKISIKLMRLVHRRALRNMDLFEIREANGEDQQDGAALGGVEAPEAPEDLLPLLEAEVNELTRQIDEFDFTQDIGELDSVRA